MTIYPAPAVELVVALDMSRGGWKSVGQKYSHLICPMSSLPAQIFKRRTPGIHLIHGNAEQLPFGDESLDYALSEYGAAIWCDPFIWVPEAARVLCL